MNDGLLEVVAIDNLDLAILHAGGMYFLRIETVKTSFVEPLLIFYNINQIYCGFLKNSFFLKEVVPVFVSAEKPKYGQKSQFQCK